MGILDHRVAVVTGAGSGIGQATALRLAEEGAHTVVVDVVSTAGEETVDIIRERGGDGVFVEADVSDRGAVTDMVATVEEVCGGIHILHNNAGVGGAKMAHEETEENWDRIIRVNLKSVYLCCQAVIPVMLKQGGGSIINTASVLGLVASPSQAAYCAAKGAVVMLTKQMAIDYATQGIRVNCVCPSDIETPAHERFFASRDDPEAVRESLLSRHPVHRFGKPEEVAEAVLWLASDAASFITGIALPVDGGLTAW
jgi:NAD(P)-dependent dehydrogenase (short-subunit alcohol dehydrogenase family)